MGIYRRPDSPYWWLWLETAPRGRQRERTPVKVGESADERRDNRQLAHAIYRERMTQIAGGRYGLPQRRPEISFADYVAIYRRDVIPHHKGARRENEILAMLMAAFADEPLSTIDRERVRRWIAERAQKVQPRTVNREVDVLKQLMKEAVPKYLARSPIVGLKRLKAPTPARRLLTPQEERRLLAAAADPQERAIIVLGRDTLARLGDLIDLRRADRRGLWLTIRDPKGGEAYEVPLSPRAAKALDAIPDERRQIAGRIERAKKKSSAAELAALRRELEAAEYFFTRFRRAKDPRDWPSSVRQRFERLCAEAGIPYGQKRGGVTFHWATRRTGATQLLVARNQPVPVVQRLGNWKKPDVLLQIYTEAQRGDLLKAVGQRGEKQQKRAQK